MSDFILITLVEIFNVFFSKYSAFEHDSDFNVLGLMLETFFKKIVLIEKTETEPWGDGI